MKYEFGQKLKQKENDLVIEINALFPKSFGVRIDTTEDNYYRVLVNGVQMILSEKALDIIFEKHAIKSPVETVVENLINIPENDQSDFETPDEVLEEIKKPSKRGRPAKIKK